MGSLTDRAVLLLTVDRECCLTGASPALLAKLRAELTIDNPKYQAAKQFGRWIGSSSNHNSCSFARKASAFSFPEVSATGR